MREAFSRRTEFGASEKIPNRTYRPVHWGVTPREPFFYSVEGGRQMLGWNRRESVASWVVLSLALILTALLPNIVVGDSSAGPQGAPTPAPSYSASSFTDTSVADFSA